MHQGENTAPISAKTRVISMFSLARKAGKLVAGMDMVKDTVAARRIRMVFVTSDLAPRSLKEIRFVCRPTDENPQGVQVIPMNIAMDDMAVQIGRRSGILAVADTGFEKKLAALIEETNMPSRRESC